MLALFDNPFFVRERRLAWRREFTPFHWVVTSVAVTCGALLFLLFLNADSPARPGPRESRSAWWLLLPHLITCLIAAARSAGRAIGDTSRESSFELERLVSLKPAEWVIGKMAYPAVLTTVVWSAPIPVLLVAGVFDLVRRQELMDWVAGPLVASIASIPVSFLSNGPQPVKPDAAATQSDSADRFHRWLSDLVRGWIWLAWFVTGVFIVFRPVRQLYWLGLPVPVGLPFGLCGLTGMLSGWWAGETAFLRTRSTEQRFQRWAICAWMVLFFIPWGLFPGWIHWPLWVFVPVAVLVLTGLMGLSIARGPQMKRDRRRLSGLALRELEWLEREWPNALLQLDLTRALRVCSPLVAFVNGIGVIVVVAVPAAVAAVRQPSLVPFARFMVGVISIHSLGTAVPVVSTLWANDRKSGFLDSLFLTPQSSAELIAGRLAAAAGSHGVHVLAISGALGFSSLGEWAGAAASRCGSRWWFPPRLSSRGLQRDSTER